MFFKKTKSTVPVTVTACLSSFGVHGYLNTDNIDKRLFATFL